MKVQKIIFINLFLLLLFSSPNAQKDEFQPYKLAAQNILKLSKEKKYNKVAAFMAYNKSDLSRKYKDNFNPEIRNELKEVRRISKKVNALLLISNSHSMGKIYKKKFNNLKATFVEINFKSGRQQLKMTFIFINFNNKILLADVV